MAMRSAASVRADRRARTLRLRTGVARTFGPLFVVLVFVLLLPGALFLYDAVTHPLTADSAQVMIGSICVAFSVLLVFFLVRESR
jgi:hypothetical protein